MSIKYQRGLGIPELLIGITIGMIVVGAAMSLLQVTLHSSNDNIKMARLEQELRQAMQMVSRDLRRAGWWDGAMDVAKVSMNSYLKLSAVSGSSVAVTSVTNGAIDSIGSKAVGGTLIHVASDGTVKRGSITAYNSGSHSFTVNISTAWPSYVTDAEGVAPGSWNIIRPEAVVTLDTTNHNCVLISYDNTSDGSFTTPEFFGYKLSGNALQMRYSGAVGDTCASGGTWENLTNSNFIQITGFNVAENLGSATSNGLTINVREYEISITGQLVSDPNTIRTLRETIKVRNDRIV